MNATDTAIVRIIGFRGAGWRDIRFADAHDLVKAGHVGISFEDDDIIYGFSPSVAAIAQLKMLDLDTISILKQGSALHGQIRDDTVIFEMVASLAITYRYPEINVYQIGIVISRKAHDQIHDDVLKQVDAGCPFPSWYSFPLRTNNPMPKQCNNCATWPRALGLPVPEWSGRLALYSDILRETGYLWGGYINE